MEYKYRPTVWIISFLILTSSNHWFFLNVNPNINIYLQKEKPFGLQMIWLKNASALFSNIDASHQKGIEMYTCEMLWETIKGCTNVNK